MENLINSIITFDNDEKYIVLNQATYQGKNYFFVVKTTADEEDIEEKFKLLEETELNGEKALQLVTDEKIIDLLTKYFTPAK